MPSTTTTVLAAPTVDGAVCPTWCVDSHTDPADFTDAFHRGAPTRIKPAHEDASAAVEIARWDERPHGNNTGHRGNTTVLLTVTNGGFVADDGSVLQLDVSLTPDDADALAALLTTIAAQARLDATNG